MSMVTFYYGLKRDIFFSTVVKREKLTQFQRFKRLKKKNKIQMSIAYGQFFWNDYFSLVMYHSLNICRYVLDHKRAIAVPVMTVDKKFMCEQTTYRDFISIKKFKIVIVL